MDTILIDFGTTFNKTSVHKDGEFLSREMMQNRLYEITPEYLASLERFEEAAKIEPGLYTDREVKPFAGHAKEIPVQTGAVTFEDAKLITAYRNTMQHLEETHGITILDDPSEWYVMSAVALPETEEIQAKLRAKHEKVLLDMGFAGAYVRNQVILAVVGNLDKLSSVMTADMTCCVADIGGGDTKAVCVSTAPMPTTVKRESIGGGDVIQYCRKIIEEEMNLPVYSTMEIQDWLINWGSSEGTAEERKVIFRNREIDITKLLNVPRMLFEPAKFAPTTGKRSITRVILDSLDAARLKGKDLLFNDIISAILVTGGGSLWGGLLDRLKREMEAELPEFAGKLNLVPAEEPQWATLNGMVNLLTTKTKQKQDLDWVR